MGSRRLGALAVMLMAGACSHQPEQQAPAPQRQASDAEVSRIGDAIRSREAASHPRVTPEQLTFGRPTVAGMRALRSGSELLLPGPTKR